MSVVFALFSKKQAGQIVRELIDKTANDLLVSATTNLLLHVTTTLHSAGHYLRVVLFKSGDTKCCCNTHFQPYTRPLLSPPGSETLGGNLSIHLVACMYVWKGGKHRPAVLCCFRTGGFPRRRQTVSKHKRSVSYDDYHVCQVYLVQRSRKEGRFRRLIAESSHLPNKPTVRLIHHVVIISCAQSSRVSV